MTTRATSALQWLSREWERFEDNAYLRNDAATQSGIVGDPAHRAKGGYHISRQDQPKTNYSVIRADDKPGNGPDDAAAAIDMTYSRTEDLIACYSRLTAVWKNRATHPAARYINAFNGWDGKGSAGRKDMVTGGWTWSDDTHKWHIHLEIRRKYVEDMNAMRIILAALTGTGEGMNQSELLTAETGNGGRTVGMHLGDMQRMRNWLLGESGAGRVDIPPAGSPLARVVGAADLLLADRIPVQVQLTPADLEAVASMVAEKLGGRLDRIVTAMAAAGTELAKVDDPA